MAFMNEHRHSGSLALLDLTQQSEAGPEHTLYCCRYCRYGDSLSDYSLG